MSQRIEAVATCRVRTSGPATERLGRAAGELAVLECAALTKEHALRELRAGAARQFDPAMVAAVEADLR